MLHYSSTGLTKSPELRINRPIFALLLIADLPFTDLSSERISVDIERSGGSNTTICNQFPVAPLATLGSHGFPAIVSTAQDFKAMLVLASGAIQLKETETIKVTLTGLDASKTYSLHSIESPRVALNPFKYEQKVIGSDDVSKDFEIMGFAKCQISGISEVNQIFLTHQNGTLNKFEVPELVALAEADDIITIIQDGQIMTSPDDSTIFDVSELVKMEVFKESGSPVVIYLKS